MRSITLMRPRLMYSPKLLLVLAEKLLLFKGTDSGPVAGRPSLLKGDEPLWTSR